VSLIAVAIASRGCAHWGDLAGLVPCPRTRPSQLYACGHRRARVARDIMHALPTEPGFTFLKQPLKILSSRACRYLLSLE
jgi:hypothetical protein